MKRSPSRSSPMIRLQVTNAQDIKPLKDLLEENQWLNRSFKIEKADGTFHIYTTLKTIPGLLSHLRWDRYKDQEKPKQSLASIRDRYCSDHDVPYFDVPKDGRCIHQCYFSAPIPTTLYRVNSATTYSNIIKQCLVIKTSLMWH